MKRISIPRPWRQLLRAFTVSLNYSTCWYSTCPDPLISCCITDVSIHQRDDLSFLQLMPVVCIYPKTHFLQLKVNNSCKQPHDDTTPHHCSVRRSYLFLLWDPVTRPMAVIYLFFNLLFPSLFVRWCPIKAPQPHPHLPIAVITASRHGKKMHTSTNNSERLLANEQFFCLFGWKEHWIVHRSSICVSVCFGLALTLLLQLSAASTPQRKHWLLFYVKHLTVVRSGIVFYIVTVVTRRRVIVNTNEDYWNPSGGIWNMDLQISRWWNVSVTNEETDL